MDLNTYIITGFLITLAIDYSIRELESSEPFTVFEILLFTILWPFMLFIIIKEFFKNHF
jgi:hypothetical protein